jgi:hypothetical protein
MNRRSYWEKTMAWEIATYSSGKGFDGNIGSAGQRFAHATDLCAS